MKPKLPLLASFLIIAFALLSGCATGPKFSEVKDTLPALAPDKGRLYVYRTAVMGAAVQPDVRVSGDVVGSAKPKGFFIVDRPAGEYKVSSSTEVTRTLSLTLAAGQTRYVRLNLAMGFFVGHVFPELVENAVGEKEIAGCSYIGGK